MDSRERYKDPVRIFLTGATGYIGSAVTRAIKVHGHEIIALVRTGENARKVEELGYRPVIGDMLKPESWKPEAASADALVHVAQLRWPRRVTAAWVRSAQEADGIAFRGLMEAAREGGRCRALIYTSGAAVHGDHGDVWIDEDIPPTPGVIGSYHLAGEKLVEEAHRQGLPAFALRPALPYGPSGTFANFFLAQAVKGKFKYIGSGENFQPTVFIEDLAEAYALAVERPPAGKVITIVDDEPLRMREVATILLDEFGGGKAKGMPVWVAALFMGRPIVETIAGSYRVRNMRAKGLLGWKPRYPTFREGIKEVVSEYKRHLVLAA